MAVGEARLFIDRSAAVIAEFVLDLKSYSQIDAKLGKIYWVERDGNAVTFRFRPRLLGLPGPPTTQRVVLADDGRTIRIGGIPSALDRMASFAASFTFDERDGGTWVTRRVEFTFAKPVAAVLDPLFGRWLQRDVDSELAGAKRLLEAR